MPTRLKPLQLGASLAFDRQTPRGEASFVANEFHHGVMAQAIELAILKFMPAQKAVLAVLEDGPASPHQIARLLSRKAVRSTLYRMEARGLVRHVRRGVWEKVR